MSRDVSQEKTPQLIPKASLLYLAYLVGAGIGVYVGEIWIPIVVGAFGWMLMGAYQLGQMRSKEEFWQT